MKLRTKIQLFSSLFMLVIIVLVNTSIYILFDKISTNNELEQLTLQTKKVVETLNTNEEIPPNEILRAFLPENGMIRVIAENGEEIIPTITKKKEYVELPFTFRSQEVKEIHASKTMAKIAVIQKPIIWTDGSVVMLSVSNELIVLSETMRTLLIVLLAASVFILVPTILAGNTLSRFILQPIIALINTMKRNMRREEWAKIDIKSRTHDELFDMEQTFNEMIDHLRANFEKQAMFVSDASHELKTPISIIKSYAQLIERRSVEHPEVLEESVEAIGSEADRMQELVEQLLLLAKNKDSMQWEQVELLALTKRTIKPFQATSVYEVSIEAHVDNVTISGEEKQLQQVLYILISNALKYSEADVKIILDKEDSTAILKVIDHGMGIAEVERELIFDRFYRIDKARARETGGTGLGLAIAKQIIQAHGGSIQVESVPDVGSTFTIHIPI